MDATPRNTPKTGLLFATNVTQEDLSHAAMPPLTPRKPSGAFWQVTLADILLTLSIVLLALATYYRH